MKRRSDGSFQSSNTPTWQNVGLKEDFCMYRCMVTNVLYADDNQNITKNAQNPEVVYEVVILGGFSTGQILSNVRLASDLGGNNNYSDRVLTPTSKKLSDVGLEQHDGDIVFVQFIQGHQGFPVIIALGQGISDLVSGTKRSDGPRSIKEYNGLIQEINNKGEYLLKSRGGKLNDQNVFIPVGDGTFDVVLSILNNQVYSRVFKNGLHITEDGINDSSVIKTKAGGEINLTKGKVALGTSAVELLQQISDQLNKILTFMNNVDANHQHFGNLGYLTDAPFTASEFTQLGTDLSVIKSNVDSIKGTIT